MIKPSIEIRFNVIPDICKKNKPVKNTIGRLHVVVMATEKRKNNISEMKTKINPTIPLLVKTPKRKRAKREKS